MQCYTVSYEKGGSFVKILLVSCYYPVKIIPKNCNIIIERLLKLGSKKFPVGPGPGGTGEHSREN